MKIEVADFPQEGNSKDFLVVKSVQYNAPGAVISGLNNYLNAARLIWPELENYKIIKDE